MSALPRVFLRPGHDRRLAHGYPWAYSNEVRIDDAAKALVPGSLVSLHRGDGKPLGVGSFNAHTLIAFRLYDRDPARPIDETFFASRLERALRLRRRLFAQPYYRLVHAEADGIPGLIADRFGDVLVLQANTAGSDRLLPEILAAAAAVLQPAAIVLRNDSPARRAEGLASEVRVAVGAVAAPVEVHEGGVGYLADVLAGQKTGWFFDQRDGRGFVAALAADGRLLDVYCHSGGFALAAAAAGARAVLGIDSSEPALALAAASARTNGLADRAEFRKGEAFAELERRAAAGERWDVVVADPPAFVKSRKDLAAGLRGYRKLARLAAQAVAPGGFLFLASCSHNVTPEAFTLEVARGLVAAGRSGRIVRQGGTGADHPLHPQLAESAYLKTLVLAVD